MKRIFSILLMLSLICSPVSKVNASEYDYNNVDNGTIAQITGISVEEIEEARIIYGNDFGEVISDYITSTVYINQEVRSTQPQVLSDAETGNSFVSVGRISNTNWDFMKEKFKKGQILITDDATTLGYNHGHAAILVSSTKTVEHLGSKTTTYSGYYDVSWWQGFSTIKSLNYSSNSVMSSAGTYAYNNLQGKEYNVLASRTSSKVNCATLVWKAYNSQGINIVDSTSGTVKPEDFDNSSKLSWVRSVGWNNVNWGF